MRKLHYRAVTDRSVASAVVRILTRVPGAFEETMSSPAVETETEVRSGTNAWIVNVSEATTREATSGDTTRRMASKTSATVLNVCMLLRIVSSYSRSLDKPCYMCNV